MSEERNENNVLRRVFGMLQDNVRIYQIAEDRDVFRDEFQYCQIMQRVMFGPKGFVETLGPTWRMVHDPRFIEIENMMVQERKAIFGGDARMGKQYFNDDGAMNSTVSDLEKYAEILGEGRNLYNVLAHPDEKCQVRLWLERIYRGFTNIKPHTDFRCTCYDMGDEAARVQHALTAKDWSEQAIWDLIKVECPNRTFTKSGSITAYGKLMFNLIRADLIGLIHDYAITPLIDSYVYLRDHGVVTGTETVAYLDPHGQDAPRVSQEVDILEQALTHRATLRVTAYKILKRMGFETKLINLTGSKILELTDVERDEILQLVYESDYPEPDPKFGSEASFIIPADWRPFETRLKEWEQALEEKLLAFVNSNILHADYDQREAAQLTVEKQEARAIISGLLDGSILPINEYTEPLAEIPADQNETEVMKYAAILEAIMSNEFKQELYLLAVEAEKQNDTAIIDILSPIFLTPDYPLDEAEFYRVLERIRIGSKSLRAERMDAIRGVKQVTENTADQTDVKAASGEFHSKANPGGIYRGEHHQHDYKKVRGLVQLNPVNVGQKNEHLAYFLGDHRLRMIGDDPFDFTIVIPFLWTEAEVLGEFDADGWLRVKEITGI